MVFHDQIIDIISLSLNILFFIMIFISLFYGRRLKAWKSQKTIETSLEKLKKWNIETKNTTISKFKRYCDNNLTVKDIENKINDFLNFIVIMPVGLDPSGLIPKIDHILDVREYRYLREVKDLAIKANNIEVHNLENLLEATMAINQIYRTIRHYLLLGKKTKSYMLLMQTEMQLGLLMGKAKAYFSAAKAFAEGSPIGDGLGPLVIGNWIRDISQKDDVPYDEIAYETIVQKCEFEQRKIYTVRAKGPGGTVGKPGVAIQKLVNKFGNEISLIIMIDATLKMEGDKTGSVVLGVGAAIGGVGVEKFKIEESSTQKKIPIDAIICRESLEDAICTMKKSIINSVPVIIDKIRESIRKRTKINDKVIVAGIGNSIGIGI